MLTSSKNKFSIKYVKPDMDLRQMGEEIGFCDGGEEIKTCKNYVEIEQEEKSGKKVIPSFNNRSIHFLVSMNTGTGRRSLKLISGSFSGANHP